MSDGRNNRPFGIKISRPNGRWLLVQESGQPPLRGAATTISAISRRLVILLPAGQVLGREQARLIPVGAFREFGAQFLIHLTILPAGAAGREVLRLRADLVDDVEGRLGHPAAYLLESGRIHHGLTEHLVREVAEIVVAAPRSAGWPLSWARSHRPFG